MRVDSLLDWRIGILGQALVPLAIGTTVVVAAATVVVWHHTVDQERTTALHALAQRSEASAWAEQPTFDRVARQVRGCRDVFVARLAHPLPTVEPPPRHLDGTRRELARLGDVPVSVFISPRSASEDRDLTAACTAWHLVRELGPALAEHPANLSIAAAGRWLVGWGEETRDLVDAMLPDDPVLLPAEQEVVGEPGPVRWSRAFFEPASSRWQVVATATAETPQLGRISFAQILPVDEILARAAAGDSLVTDTVVFDANGRILASNLGDSGSTLVQSPNRLLRDIAVQVPVRGPTHQLIPLEDGSGFLGVSRFPGPDWIMVTFHAESAIADQARTSSWYALLFGCALLASQTVLLFVVLRQRVARPLQQLSQAAAALTAGRRDIVLPSGRSDEVGRLSTAFALMSSAIVTREEELRATAEALREREQLASALVASAADAVLIIIGGAVTEANPRACALLGTPLHGMIGQRMDMFSPELQPDGRSSREALDGLLAKAAQGAVMHFSWRHRRLNGQEFDAEIGLARIDMPGTARLVAVVRDVTERNLLEDQLRQGQKLESLGQLAGGIAHDFNNMLAGIMGAAELLKHRADQSRREVLIETIITASERASGLTRKLLTFARKGRAMSSPIDAHQIIQDTIAMLCSGLDKRIRLDVELGASHATIVGDATQLQNALINLGVNARDAMPDGGAIRLVTRDVELDESAAERQPLPVSAGPFIEISVVDTGSGIPAEIIGRVFEPFFTTKPVGKGTGLGLAAVWGTVRDHHGSIRVDSVVGIGTTFSILLPVVDHRPTASYADRAIVRRPGRGTILLVDDEDIVRASARMLLEEIGWVVIEAVDGRHGVEVFAREADRIDIIMVDMEMPRLRGIDCLREIRAIRPGVKAVVCSGFARDTTAAQLRDEGFQGQLVKPYRLSELSGVLDSVMRGG